MPSPELNFSKLNLDLPPAPKPMGVYKPMLIVDSRWVYVSGHGTVQSDGTLIRGRIGDTLDLEQGKSAARQVGLAILATLREWSIAHRILNGTPTLSMDAASCLPPSGVLKKASGYGRR